MAEENKNIKLGLFVLIGSVLLIIALYFIGTKQNMFGNTFRISATFNSVNGLMKGNNVRFAGIDVGTVESIKILNDSLVNITMLIEEETKPYIKKNAIASVGTDGLMGNKLVNINSSRIPSPGIQENDVLKSLMPVEMDEMVRTLNITNENIKVISLNLRTITDKINSKNSLWSLLLDTVVAQNLKASVVNIKLMSNNALYVTGDLKNITTEIKKGKGIGALITDTSLALNIQQTIVKLNKVSDSAAIITGNISHVLNRVKSGQGSIGVLLNDTNFVYNLNQSVRSINGGAMNFSENMEALKYSWPFKKYFKKNKKLQNENFKKAKAK